MDSNISMVYQFQLQPCKTAINVQTPSRNDKIAGLRNVYQNFYMFHTRHGCLGSWFSVHRKSRNCSNPWAGFSFSEHLNNKAEQSYGHRSEREIGEIAYQRHPRL